MSVLDLARPDCLLIDAGKQPGDVALTQDETTRTLIEHGRSGIIVDHYTEMGAAGPRSDSATACRFGSGSSSRAPTSTCSSWRPRGPGRRFARFTSRARA